MGFYSHLNLDRVPTLRGIVLVSSLCNNCVNITRRNIQRLSVEAFFKGFSVVVSAPTSSRNTLIAEAAVVATVARGKRLFYTTPLKALSNQIFSEFRLIIC
ncbi:hypothetical protein ACET3Z_024691 [Daucus carota]